MSSTTIKLSTTDFVENEYIINAREIETIYLQSSGFTFSVKGNIGNKTDWTDLSLINSTNYNFLSSVSADGLYIVDTSALDYFKIVITDSEENATLLVKVVGDLWQLI